MVVMLQGGVCHPCYAPPPLQCRASHPKHCSPEPHWPLLHPLISCSWELTWGCRTHGVFGGSLLSMLQVRNRLKLRLDFSPEMLLEARSISPKAAELQS